MLQAPFGTTGPGWMTMASPGIAWLPTPVAPVNPALTAAHAHAGLDVGPPSGLPLGGQGGAPGTFGWGNVPTGFAMSHMPLSTPFAVPDGVTPTGLLGVIAIRRGQPQGPTSDQDVEEFIYDALELLPGAGDVEVRCETGRVTLSGSVPHKRLKRDVGEIAWAIPGINDLQNTISIATRRRSRGFARDNETPPAVAGRKQA